MKRAFILLLVLITAIIPSTAQAPIVRAAEPKPLVSHDIMKLWNHVATCETGGNWQMHGSRYSGGLGIRNDVWLEYGGARYGQYAGLATPQQQVTIARAIQARAGVPNFVPDQEQLCQSW